MRSPPAHLAAFVAVLALWAAPAWAQEEADEVEEEEEEEEVEEGEVFELEDDAFDVGADVEFSEEDLESTEAASGSGEESGSVTRLETLALAFGRMGVDLAHDEKTIGADGVATGREDTFFFRFHGRAEGTGRFGRWAKIVVGGRFDAETSFDQSTNFGIQRYEGRIWETYVDLYGERVDLRAGNQIIPWGYADLLSPNDVINPRDLRRGPVQPIDELRIPVLAARSTAYAGPLSLTGVYVPVAPANEFELLDGDYATFGPNAPTAAERRVGAILRALADDPALAPSLAPILAIGDRPDHGLETGELGASAQLRTAHFDAATYFYWGHERNPRIQVAPELAETLGDTNPELITPEVLAEQISELSMMGVASVLVDYPRRLHYGAAAATRIGGVGVKLDGAYTPAANAIVVPVGGGPLLAEPRDLPQAGATLSIDYDRGRRLSLIFEGSYSRVFDVPAGSEVFRLDGDELYLIGSRFSWKPLSEIIELRFLGFVDVTSPSYAVKPAVRLSGHDNLALEIALGLYGGPAGSFGGLLDRNDEVLFTVEYGL